MLALDETAKAYIGRWLAPLLLAESKVAPASERALGLGLALLLTVDGLQGVFCLARRPKCVRRAPCARAPHAPSIALRVRRRQPSHKLAGIDA